MGWTAIKSSNLDMVRYDKDKNTLHIIFANGSEYQYKEVSIQRYNSFLSAESKGKYFHLNIKDKYESKRIV